MAVKGIQIRLSGFKLDPDSREKSQGEVTVR